ncbi:MAG: glycoside hydrolase family 95 protein [Clostridia bacterium]|nr:glycoside hydrolase family 95 protein [Clostridia bacterium]
MNAIKSSKDSNLLFEKTESCSFEDAFPLGNGSLGATVYGGVLNETVSLNHDTLWSGYPKTNVFRGNKKSALDKAKALLREKKYVDADAVFANEFSSYGCDAFMPMGSLGMNFSYGEGKISSYSRSLDLSKGIASVSYKVGSASFERTAFVSHPDNVFVYRTEGDGTVFSVKISLSSQLYSKTYAIADASRLFLEGECPVTSEQKTNRTDAKTLYFDEPEKRGVRFLCGLCILTDGNKVSNGNAVTVTNATYIELRLTARTSYNGYNKHPFLEGKEYKNACVSALNTVYGCDTNELLASHVKDHSRYYSRVAVNVGSSNKSRTPTSARIELYNKGAQDKALPALLFNYGRYLTIAASRKGSLATSLQGIWNEHFFAPWQSDYTVNINTEMNYFPTLMVNLKEMYEPLISLIKSVSDRGRETASVMYGADGWVCHHNTDPWAFTQPVPGLACWSFWNACGAWLCHHLMEYYEYTLDTEFLKKTAFPIMCESARFYLSQLEDSDDGYRIVFASTSPENRFIHENARCAVSETTEMTMAAVRELFANVLKASKLIDITNDVTLNVENELPRLRPSKIGSDGRLLEWYNEHPECEVHHRHVSHLYSLHPGNAISPLTTPELAEACRKTLEVRGDEGTGWSLAWKCNFFARLLDGDHALSLVKQQLRPCRSRGINYSGGGGSYPNLLCAHPPFQIDGNFGVTSGICEMLLQSSPDTVHVIPALPTEWATASYRGLRAKGKRTVSAVIENGELSECELKGSMPQKILVAGKDLTDRFVYENGKAIYRK